MFTKLALLITLTFHPQEWRAASLPWRLGVYQQIDGPTQEFVSRLWYDDRSGHWEVQEGSSEGWIWTVLYDGDVLTMDDKGTIRIKGL